MADLKTTNIYGDAYINNKVGIATNAPATRLQIGQLSPTAATEGIQFGDDTGARIYRDSAGIIKVAGGFTSTNYILAGNYLQTAGNLIYPGSQTATQRLEVGNASGNAWVTGIAIAQGGNVTVYNNLTVNNGATVTNDLTVNGNTYLGNANNDTVYVNDTIRIGATDSGDASLFFGEGSVAGSDYGARWYWDSGYTFTWYTRNAGTDTALFDYVTNDLNYINWRRHFHMQNKEINYSSQVHFNAGTRFVGQDTNYLVFRSDSTSVGGIRVQDGGIATKGYIGYWDSSGGGILNNTGNWALRYNFGNTNSGGTLYGAWTVNGNISATNLSGTNTGDQSIGNGTITIAAGTGVGVGTTNTFTTNQSGATTVTITNNGVTSAVAGTGVGVSAATGAVTFSIGQSVGPANTPSFAGIISSAVTGYAYLQVVDVNNFWITPGNVNWGLYFETTAGGLLGGTGDSNRLGFVGSGTARFYVDLNNGNGWFGGTLTAAGNISAANLSGTNTGDQSIGNGTITIAAGTGVGVGSSNTFTTNQSGATTVTITNNGVTSNVAGTGITVSGATGAVTITNSGVTSLAGTTNRITVSGATGAVTLNLPQDIHTGASPSFSGLTVTGITMTNLTGAYQNTTVYDSPRTQSATPSRGIRAPASSIQFTDSYAIAPFYTYRSTGDWPVPYGIGWGTGGESSGIFQRYASNGYSFGDMIFYTGNDGSGAFSFRRHTWEGTTYFAAGSGELNTELFRIDWAGKATATSFALPGGFTITDPGSGYAAFSNWVLLGTTGFYSSTNSAHLHPNTGTYGSWKITGTRGGWGGIEFESGTILMANSSESGFYRVGYGWQMWWSGGTGYVHKGNPGGGTQATILDSSNYTSYTPGLGTNNTLTGINTINNTSNTVINNQSGNLGLTMFQATAGTDAYMTFHIGSDFAAYFGLGGAENDLVYGGWSAGNNRHRILHSGNAAYAWNMNQYVRTTDNVTFGTVTATLSGNATTATSADNIDGRPFVNTNSNSGTNADSINSNGISYYTGGVTNFSGNATDGGLYSQAYSNDWQHQIAGDYRSGQIALRGKNSGTWQSWRRVLDDTNSPYALNMNQYVRTTDSPTFATLQLTRLNFGATGAAPYATAAGEGTGNGITFGGDEAGHAYRIFTGMENIGGNYSKLTFNWHTGIRLGAYTGYGGIRFYNNSVGSGTEIFSVGNGDNNVRVVNTLYIGGNTALHAGNYNSYALPLSGGTLASTNDQILTLNKSSGTGWGYIGFSQAGTRRFYFGLNASFEPELGVDNGGTFRVTGGMTVGGNTVLTTGGGQTIAGITYFSNGESINAYGIRGRFTNEYLHLYNKVGVGHPSGWGQGETSTPDKGLSTYGGLNIAYGDNGISTFNGVIRANSNIRQGADLARPLANWSVAGTSTGMVIFSFPGNTGNYGMVHCVFDIYEYNSNTVSTVIVGGHNYNGAWYNTGANVIGRCGKSVRLGVKDSKYCVVFGGAASSWEYGTIVLRKIHNGGFYTGIMDMGGSFTTQQTATESFSNISGDLRALRTSADFIADGGISGTTGFFSSDLSSAGNYQIRNGDPTITFRDTDHRTAFIHVNSNIFYILTGAADSPKGSWGTVANGRWPLEINLNTNNAVFGADVNAISFTGAGTGLTGTASSLSIGGNAGSISGFNNPTTAATANTIVYRDANGHITGQYILGSYFNASAGNGENPTIGQIWTQNTTDNYLRKSTPAHFRSQVTDGSYPSLTGANASGTWSINITGNATTATTSLRSTIEDTRAAQRTPNDYDDYRASYEFTNAITGLGDWHTAFTLQGWHNGYAAWQIIGPASTSAHENFYLRSGVNTTWNSVRTILHSGNYNSYSPTLTGTGASGTWAINITGNAATATTATNVTIANGSVTLAKIENITAYTILGNSNASAAATPAALSVATVATMLSGQTMNINGSSTSCSGTATNATTAGGLAVHTGTNDEANKIVRTQGNGYIMAGWINTISGDNGTTAIDRVYASSDGYIRYYTPANFRTVLDVPTRAGSGASGNWAINITGNAATATNVAASGITGQTGMWTSAARPGPYRLYRNDDNSAYNVQLTWQAHRTNYWSLRGYLNDTFHAECFVVYSGYADSAGSAGALTTGNTYQVANIGIGVAASNRLHINGDGSNPTIRIDNTAFGSGTSSSRAFYGWLPIGIDGFTRYIQLYS